MSADDLPAQINLRKLPRHIAVIMDGNGRWARNRHLPRIAGHREGVRSVDEIVTTCQEIGVGINTPFVSERLVELRCIQHITRRAGRKEVAGSCNQNLWGSGRVRCHFGGSSCYLKLQNDEITCGPSLPDASVKPERSLKSTVMRLISAGLSMDISPDTIWSTNAGGK